MNEVSKRGSFFFAMLVSRAWFRMLVDRGSEGALGNKKQKLL